MDFGELLRYGFEGVRFGLAFLAPVALVAFMLGLYRSPLVGCVAVLALTVWEAAEYSLPALQLGLNIYPHDVVLLCLSGAAVLRLAFVPGALRGIPRPLLVLLGMLALSFAIGVAKNGTRAGVEFRSEFYLWTICLYLLTFRPERGWLDRLLSLWMFAAFLMCAVVWYRWAADAFGLTWFAPVWRYGDTTGVAFRVAPAEVAFALGLAALVSVSSLAAGAASPVHFVLLPALLLTIVMLQHRSVWVSTMLPLFLLVSMLLGSRRQSARGPLLVIAVSVGLAAVALGSGGLEGLAGSVADQATRATSTSDGTFVARVNGWQQLLGQWSRSGLLGLLAGQPYGSGFERYATDTWGAAKVTYSPHNYYVTILLRTGLVGLAVLFALFWRLARASLTMGATEHRFGPPLIAAFTLSIMVHSIPYTPTTASGLLLGAALCCAQRRSDVRLQGAPVGVTSAKLSKRT